MPTKIAVSTIEWESIGGGSGQDLSSKQDQSDSTSADSGEEEESNSAKLWRIFCGVAVVTLRWIFSATPLEHDVFNTSREYEQK